MSSGQSKIEELEDEVKQGLRCGDCFLRVCTCGLLKSVKSAVPFPEPMEAVNNIMRPDYYRVNIKGVELDVYDIAKAYQLTPPLFNALKYILRAGKKNGNSVTQDVSKAISSLQRELE